MVSHERQGALFAEVHDNTKKDRDLKKLTMLIAGGILSAALPITAEAETVGGHMWTCRINGDSEWSLT